MLVSEVKIWAHRGCSLRNPENTLKSFGEAIKLKNLTGIELDIQVTKDGELVVIHDERVDRTTEGIGFVRDYTLKELKTLNIYPGEKIPTMNEVFDLIGDRLKNGMKLNIELKNSVYPYPGMEEKIAKMVADRGLESSIVYSSFYAKSISLLKEMEVPSELAILDTKVSDCLYKLKGGCGAVSLHPFWRAMDLSKEELTDMTVRAWMSGYLYPEKPSGNKLDLTKISDMGITDIIMNEPESYIC